MSEDAKLLATKIIHLEFPHIALSTMKYSLLIDFYVAVVMRKKLSRHYLSNLLLN